MGRGGRKLDTVWGLHQYILQLASYKVTTSVSGVICTYCAPIALPKASMLSGIACAGGVDVPEVLGVATLAAKLFRLLLLSAILQAVTPEIKRLLSRLLAISLTLVRSSTARRFQQAIAASPARFRRAEQLASLLFQSLFSNASKE